MGVTPPSVKVAPQSGEIARKFEKDAPPSMNGISIPKLQLDSYLKNR